ncbi:MAG: glutamate synthase central domain-containing protein, partial [Bacteroidota bacterium]
PGEITERGKLGPGQFLVADLTTGELFRDAEVKQQLAAKRPYGEWLNDNKIEWASLKEGDSRPLKEASELHFRHLLFGISREEIQTVLAPMAGQGKEPIGSMGADTPLAVLSEKPQHLANYFKQLFAQVSNPPIDPIREAAVMSLRTWIGPGKNLLEESSAQAVHLPLESPLLSPAELHSLESYPDPRFRTERLSVCFSTEQRLEDALGQLIEQAVEAVEAGVSILVLTDEEADEQHIPIPMLLATGAVHQTLIRLGKRPTVDLMAHSADILEVHHVATLISYGATAVIPYHAFDTLREWAERHIDFREKSSEELHAAYRKAVETGLRKIMSKMGISTIQSYHGAQIF